MPLPQMLDRLAAAGADPSVDPAHDLKTLLGVIRAACERLAGGVDAAAEQIELARVAFLAAERAGALLHRIEVRTPRPIPERAPALEGQGRTVLVVEDDPDLLRLITSAFTRAGFKAVGAADGDTGAQLLAGRRPDLMVINCVMPQMQGAAAIVEARRVSPQTALIAISGGGRHGQGERLLRWAGELGADAAVAKPFSMGQLLATAGAVLARRAAQPPTPPAPAPPTSA
jgi:CheY-like chemotaxis protein